MILKKTSRSAILAWALCTICILVALIQLGIWAAQLTGLPSLYNLGQAVLWRLVVTIVFSILAALIISRQPSNRVGWLMMLIAFASVNPSQSILASLDTPPTMLTPGLWLLIWLDGWSWVPLIFPIFLIPLHFPNGRPPSPRWNWVNWLAIGMWLFFIVFVSFLTPMGPLNEAWTVPNPIGFIPVEWFAGAPMIFWTIGLVAVLAGSVISLFVRYRKAQRVERQQIKWLLYAGALFTVVYSISAGLADSEVRFSGWWDLMFVLSILAMPAAMAIAILRYRLFEIDLIIRRTLVYGLLTVALALVYFGSVIVLQQAFRALTGQDSPLAIVISTLVIAALFSPLRRWVQDIIDQRFYRSKYDTQQALATFATTARDEVELEQLTKQLLNVVQETMQPEQVSVWLRSSQKEKN
jgi:hypothetical protein